jgi:hypothetical protein
MQKYRIIAEDVNTYDFVVEVPDELTGEEREEFIFEYLSNNRDKCWRSGEDVIVAMDMVE